MIIYWSMILWILVMYAIYSVTYKERVALSEYNFEHVVNQRIPIVLSIITFAYIIFWISIRHYVADTTLNVVTFNNMTTDFNSGFKALYWDPFSTKGKGVLFYLYILLFKCFIANDYILWLTSIAVFCGFFVFKTLRKYCFGADFFFGCFLFIVLLCFFYMMNGMRQFVCVSVAFGSVDLIKNKKTWKILLLTAVLVFVHSTAVILVPIYFIANMKPWGKNIFLFMAVIILVCVFVEPFFGGLDQVLQGTSYENDISTYFAIDDGVNPLRVMLYAVPPICSFLLRNEMKEYYEKYPILPICVNMSLLTAAIYLVGMFTSGIFIGRLPIYSELYDLILIPFLFRIGIKKEDRRFVVLSVIAVLLLYFYLTGPSVYHCDWFGTFN